MVKSSLSPSKVTDFSGLCLARILKAEVVFHVNVLMLIANIARKDSKAWEVCVLERENDQVWWDCGSSEHQTGLRIVMKKKGHMRETLHFRSLKGKRTQEKSSKTGINRLRVYGRFWNTELRNLVPRWKLLSACLFFLWAETGDTSWVSRTNSCKQLSWEKREPYIKVVGNTDFGVRQYQVQVQVLSCISCHSTSHLTSLSSGFP